MRPLASATGRLARGSNSFSPQLSATLQCCPGVSPAPRQWLRVPQARWLQLNDTAKVAGLIGSAGVLTMTPLPRHSSPTLVGKRALSQGACTTSVGHRRTDTTDTTDTRHVYHARSLRGGSRRRGGSAQLRLRLSKHPGRPRRPGQIMAEARHYHQKVGAPERKKTTQNRKRPRAIGR